MGTQIKRPKCDLAAVVAALAACREAAIAADPGEGNDGGTSNFDCPAIRLRGVREKVVQEIASQAQVTLVDFQWLGRSRWYWVGGFLNGQGNRRSVMAEAGVKKLRSLAVDGMDVCLYAQAD